MPGRRRGRLGAAEDRADAGVRVLQVGAGVALEGEHAVPVEDVVAHALGGQVGVLDGADAERARHRGLALGREVAASRSFSAAAARSTPSRQQVDQALRRRHCGWPASCRRCPSTRPNATWTAASERRAGSRPGRRRRTPCAGAATARRPPRRGGAVGARAGPSGHARGEVGRRVAVAAVDLRTMSGAGRPGGSAKPGGEHAQRAVVLDEEALRRQLLDHDGEQRVVEALPDGVVLGEEHAEQVVDLVGVAHALGHEDAP